MVKDGTDDSPTATSRIVFTSLRDDTFFLEVRAFSHLQTGQYSLDISEMSRSIAGVHFSCGFRNGRRFVNGIRVNGSFRPGPFFLSA